MKYRVAIVGDYYRRAEESANALNTMLEAGIESAE